MSRIFDSVVMMKKSGINDSNETIVNVTISL